MEDILEFEGEFRWLSNFSPSVVYLDGVEYPSVEHAYHAAKTSDQAERESIRLAERPNKAKKIGRKVKMRPDWDDARLGVMESLLRQKFADGTELARKLAATGDAMLVEGNYWNDTYWGVCRGVGENNLGKLLMKIRGDLPAAS